MNPDLIAKARQDRLIGISDKATNRVLRLWQRVDMGQLDASWAAIAPAIVQQADAAQYAAAVGSDRFTSQLSTANGFRQETASIEVRAFVGVDGSGRSTEGLLHGAVTTTKQSIGAGLSRTQSFEAGAVYLAAMMKTALADSSRYSDMVSATGRGYTQYMRLVESDACSRCIILAGATQFKPFKRHPSCRCTTQALPPNAVGTNPHEVFSAMSEVDQDRAFGKSGAQALRDGADMNQVVSARRGARGMGYATRDPNFGNRGTRMVKTTIGTRPDGSAVRVYTTTEGTTRRGLFGSSQGRLGVTSQKVGDARYATTKRVRLMPESIYEIADGNQATAKLLLRDAGYIEYPITGFGPGNAWVEGQKRMREADRLFADRIYRQRGIQIAG